MSAGYVAVLVAAMLILVYLKSRGRGYSGSQRVVLAVVAIILLIGTFIRRGESGGVVIAVLGAGVLLASIFLLRKRG